MSSTSNNNTFYIKNLKSTKSRKCVPLLIIKRCRFNSEHESKLSSPNCDTEFRSPRKTIKSNNPPNNNTFFSTSNRFIPIENSQINQEQTQPTNHQQPMESEISNEKISPVFVINIKNYIILRAEISSYYTATSVQQKK